RPASSRLLRRSHAANVPCCLEETRIPSILARGSAPNAESYWSTLTSRAGLFRFNRRSRKFRGRAHPGQDPAAAALVVVEPTVALLRQGKAPTSKFGCYFRISFGNRSGS